MIEDLIAEFTGDHIYLDANVFIYALEGFPEFSEVSRGLLEAIETGPFRCTTSELTLAEVLVHPIIKGNDTIIESYHLLLRDQAFLSLSPVTRSILAVSARVRAEVGGSLPDAIHVATALACNCDFIFTGDRAFRGPPSIRVINLRELNEEYGLGPTS